MCTYLYESSELFASVPANGAHDGSPQRADHSITKWIKPVSSRTPENIRHLEEIERVEGRKGTQELLRNNGTPYRKAPRSHLPSLSFSLPLPLPSLGPRAPPGIIFHPPREFPLSRAVTTYRPRKSWPKTDRNVFHFLPEGLGGSPRSPYHRCLRTDDACRGDGAREASGRSPLRLAFVARDTREPRLIEGGKSRSHYPRRASRPCRLTLPRLRRLGEASPPRGRE